MLTSPHVPTLPLLTSLTLHPPQDDHGTLALIKRKPKVKFSGKTWEQVSKVGGPKQPRSFQVQLQQTTAEGGGDAVVVGAP